MNSIFLDLRFVGNTGFAYLEAFVIGEYSTMCASLSVSFPAFTESAAPGHVSLDPKS